MMLGKLKRYLMIIISLSNTIHWRFGHVLTIFESALAVAGKENIDLNIYRPLFGNGSFSR